ncbi:MAG: hypothetical protein HY724_05505 [Candidatus Rokubacteria bacterium]|nr:hypothetical protein [Candidatus Rokubacteria bacterium]
MRSLRVLILGTLLLLPRGVAAYEVAPVVDGGSVTGKVLFKGEVPPPKRMLIAKNKEVCGEGYREIIEVAVRNGALENAVVLLDGIAKGKAWAAAPQKALLDQKGCVFIPPMMVVPKGGDIEILNSDPVLHNIHTYEIIGSARRTLFNFGQPNQGQRLTKPINVRRGEWVKVECDAHDFMHAWMYAAPSPYVAVTREGGSFAIADVPPGKYKVRALHPVVGIMEGEVTIPAKGKAEITFEFSPK